MNTLIVFFPQRGLRKGDPLSPYLFISCAEGLSALLQNAESERKIEGIRVCRGAPRVNHLFFADDSLILMKARSVDANTLKHILRTYELASGQMINKDKSSILFSPNTGESTKQQIRSILSINQEARNERYLGLPVSVGKSRKKNLLSTSNIRFGLASIVGSKGYCPKRGRRSL